MRSTIVFPPLTAATRRQLSVRREKRPIKILYFSALIKNHILMLHIVVPNIKITDTYTKATLELSDGPLVPLLRFYHSHLWVLVGSES